MSTNDGRMRKVRPFTLSDKANDVLEDPVVKRLYPAENRSQRLERILLTVKKQAYEGNVS